MSYDEPDLSRYFSETYRQGRAKFLAACSEAGLETSSAVHPVLKGPEGEALAIDFSLAGPPDAKRVLFMACGTHGLEAAAGSAVMLQWLEGGGAESLPEGVAVLLVHCVNPYGWAYASRGDDGGVDLNRNCLDHSAPHPDNPAYRELHPMIAAADVSEEGLAAFSRAFADFSAEKGLQYAISGIAGGQYSHSDGLSYGGAALSWSCRMLFEIACAHLAQAQKILFIDWHTGIGSFGEPFFILDIPKSDPHHALAASFWPSWPMHSDDVIDGIAPEYSGLLTEALRKQIKALNAADTVALVIEWGTYDVKIMVQALLLDRWLRLNRHHCDEAFAADVRTRLVERFLPQAPAWRRSVLEHASTLLGQAISGLARW